MLIKNKKLSCVCLCLFLILTQLTMLGLNSVCCKVNALDNVVIYVVLDEDGNELFEREEVSVGDIYISKNFYKYEVVGVDEINKTATAKFIEKMEKPSVRTYYGPSKIKNISKKICLYLTHNDESYVNGDGYDSVYGVGGIHDVAKKMKQELENKGVEVLLDETLHIPHDTSAYSRSKVTALDLLNKNPDAIFDIHRDGASRSAYLAYANGEEKSMVRIVVGKGNANNSVNQEFATYIMAVANELYPWLIKDIYIGRGHYNQNLYGKALLFEMGSHMIEKNLVLKSVEPLCEVISTALYETTVNENDNELTINGSESGGEVLITKKENLNEKHMPNTTLIIIIMLIGIVAFIGISFLINYYIDKKIMEDD